MSALSERLVKFLRGTGVPIRCGVTPEELRKFEQGRRVILPGDMRQCYLAVDGMEDQFNDDAPLRLWPLTEIKPATEELAGYDIGDQKYDSLFVFADYWLWDHAYAIKLSGESSEEDNGVVAIGGEQFSFHKVAPSFEDFLTRYLEDPLSLARD